MKVNSPSLNSLVVITHMRVSHGHLKVLSWCYLKVSIFYNSNHNLPAGSIIVVLEFSRSCKSLQNSGLSWFITLIMRFDLIFKRLMGNWGPLFPWGFCFSPFLLPVKILPEWCLAVVVVVVEMRSRTNRKRNNPRSQGWMTMHRSQSRCALL